jgi:proteasome accessory factor A
VWAGAGHVESVNGENTFYTSQKVGTLEEVFSLSTTDPKPLVNLRNEPLSAGNRYNRVHVTSGDANMSPWAIWMTLGTTSIVLRMIEDGDTIGDLASQNNALVVAQSVRSDFNLTEQIEMANGIKVTALDMQGNLIMRARQLEARGLLSTEEVPVLREWERVIDDLRIDQLRTIDRIDWVAKYNLILSYVDSRGVDFKTSTKPPLLDKLWGEMSPQGLGLKHREGAGKQWMPSEDKIKTAITTPPQTTRAKVRGGFIKAYSKVPTYDVADWHFLKLGTSKDKKLDPYDTKELKVA